MGKVPADDVFYSIDQGIILPGVNSLTTVGLSPPLPSSSFPLPRSLVCTQFPGPMPDRGGVVAGASSRKDDDILASTVKTAPLSGVRRVEDGNTRAWNTRNLHLRLGTDAIAAASAGFLIAPIITIIDRGIIENASGTRSLGKSVKASLRGLLLRPHSFFFSKPFALIFVCRVYFSCITSR